MEKEGQINPEDVEQEVKRPIEVWLVDDNVDLNRSLMAGWESAGKEFDFDSYETAKQAFEDIQAKAEEGKPLPNIIFVDGQLESDEGEFREGSNFIFRVRQMEIPQPYLIAHSSNDWHNKAMKVAGADVVMEKGIKTTLRDYLHFLGEFEAKKEE